MKPSDKIKKLRDRIVEELNAIERSRLAGNGLTEHNNRKFYRPRMKNIREENEVSPLPWIRAILAYLDEEE
jgi:hypothetical protein